MSQGFTKPPTVAGTEDVDAIHDNVGGEIAAITEKATPVSADLILIEDSAASNAKKKVQVGNLPGGSTSPLTTKGDIHTHSTVDAALAVGTDGQILKADAAETTGLKWGDNVLEQSFNQDGALATGTGTTRWYTLSAKTIVSVHASVGVTSSSGVVTVDVNKDGVTIFTTQTNRPEVAAAGYVSPSQTPDVTSFASGSYLTVDVDAAGTDAENLVVVVRFKEA